MKEKGMNVIVEYLFIFNGSIDFFEVRCLLLLYDKIMIIVCDIIEWKKIEELLNKLDMFVVIG